MTSAESVLVLITANDVIINMFVQTKITKRFINVTGRTFVHNFERTPFPQDRTSAFPPFPSGPHLSVVFPPSRIYTTNLFLI